MVSVHPLSKKARKDRTKISVAEKTDSLASAKNCQHKENSYCSMGSESPIEAKLCSLVNELVKKTPNNALVKKIMSELGISYCSDPFTQIDNVLKMVDKSLAKRLNLRRRREIESIRINSNIVGNELERDL